LCIKISRDDPGYSEANQDRHFASLPASAAGAGAAWRVERWEERVSVLLVDESGVKRGGNGGATLNEGFVPGQLGICVRVRRRRSLLAAVKTTTKEHAIKRPDKELFIIPPEVNRF